ncbi:hypothetical protein EDC04DRAFT_2189557 [Pisolithus marmoratus]|nr:hypothetical protein EDC04DRAFT_2189557 [Pisolithus marmoratus]
MARSSEITLMGIRVTRERQRTCSWMAGTSRSSLRNRMGSACNPWYDRRQVGRDKQPPRSREIKDFGSWKEYDDSVQQSVCIQLYAPTLQRPLSRSKTTCAKSGTQTVWKVVHLADGRSSFPTSNGIFETLGVFIAVVAWAPACFIPFLHHAESCLLCRVPQAGNWLENNGPGSSGGWSKPVKPNFLKWTMD